jgi:hypothetical protein
MKPIIKETQLVALFFDSCNGAMIFPFILIKPGISSPKKEFIINHEKIHFKQALELLVIGFYILYAFNFIINIFIYKFNTRSAYKNIIFEKEAYGNQNNLNYLNSRKLFSFLKRKS